MKVGAILRLVRVPAVVIVGYLLLRAVFEAQTEHGGLVSPAGEVSRALALLGVVVIGLRLVVLFVLPAVAAYALVARLLDPRHGSRR